MEAPLRRAEQARAAMMLQALFSLRSGSAAKIAGNMRRIITAVIAGLCATTASLTPLRSSATQIVPLQCFSTGETREEIESAGLLQPFVLMRRAAGDMHAEAIDGRLCRWNNELIYEISLLRRDGHIVRVLFNAANGKAVERR
jgi:hypothetical protein